MPTSCTSTANGSGQVVNLTYNLPAAVTEAEVSSDDNIFTKPLKSPISFASLQPLPIQTTSGFTNATTNSALRLSDLSSPSSCIEGSATPPIFTSAVTQQMLSEEEELYINGNQLEMALYSPLPHLQFSGSHASSTETTFSTPLEEWIKHPNNISLSSDTLLHSFHPDISSNPATPASLFSDTPLPSFSQASSIAINNDGISSVTQFALPPLENTLDFETVDLEALPP